MSDEILYNSSDIADNIKNFAKEKKIVLKDMLMEIALNSNAISSLRHGKAISAASLAKIADYLGCSVDYLLGRTDDTQVENAIELKPEEYPVIVKYRGITEQGRDTVDKLLDELHKNRNTPTAYSDERMDAVLQNSEEMRQLFQTMSQLKTESIKEIIRFVKFQNSLQESADE